MVLKPSKPSSGDAAIKFLTASSDLYISAWCMGSFWHCTAHSWTRHLCKAYTPMQLQYIRGGILTTEDISLMVSRFSKMLSNLEYDVIYLECNFQNERLLLSLFVKYFTVEDFFHSI